MPRTYARTRDPAPDDGDRLLVGGTPAPAEKRVRRRTTADPTTAGLATAGLAAPGLAHSGAGGADIAANSVARSASPSRGAGGRAPLDALRRSAARPAASASTAPVIRRQLITLRDGRTIQTAELKLKELRQIQQLYPDSSAEIQQAIDAEDFKRTRFRRMDPDSDGESDEDDLVLDPSESYYYRTMRVDEQPQTHGLRPPDGFDPTLTARQHVTSGTRAKTKSQFVSGTHSMGVSGAWASQTTGYVAKFQAPPSGQFHDLTTTQGQRDTGLTGTGLNAAKSSQEVLIGNGGTGVPPEYITSIWHAQEMDVQTYRDEGGSGSTPTEKRFSTRAQATKKPKPIRMTKIYDRDESSARRLAQARRRWDSLAGDLAAQANAQYGDTMGFDLMDADDVASLLEEIVESPHTLDYISNDDELANYLAEIDAAGYRFIEHMIATWSA